jgi:Ca2+-binding EF-hand superfamily protein
MRAKIIAISIITAIAAPAIAQRGGPIDRLDIDDDGFISREEFEIPNHRKAQRADADGDGTITLVEISEQQDKAEARMQERAAATRERAAEHFANMDADGDSAVTQEEAENFAFSKVDEDGDGYLSREEMRKQMRKHRGAKKGKGRRDRRPEHD